MEPEALLEEWSKKINLLRETIARGEARFKSEDFPPLAKLKAAFDAASAKVKHSQGESIGESGDAAIHSAAHKSIEALMQELKTAFDEVTNLTGATTTVAEPEAQPTSDAPTPKDPIDNKNAG